jgi:hypothetical protein
MHAFHASSLRSKDMSDIPPRHPRFTKIIIILRTNVISANYNFSNKFFDQMKYWGSEKIEPIGQLIQWQTTFRRNEKMWNDMVKKFSVHKGNKFR